jgi:RNA polymerase sigma factor (sigma-70 family)
MQEAACPRRGRRRLDAAGRGSGSKEDSMFGNLEEMIRLYRRHGNAKDRSAKDRNADDGKTKSGGANVGGAKGDEAKSRDAKFKQYDGEVQRDLVRRAQAGDTVARDQLLTSYVPAVVREIHSRCNRRVDEFDDCAQEVMLRLVRAVACYDLRRGAPVSSYFFQVIFRAIAKFNLRHSSQGDLTVPLADSAVPGVFDDLEDVEEGESPVERSAQRNETEEFAADLLSRADPRERQVLTNYFRGESLTAIGKRIGVSCERVRQIKERGLERIRRAVGRGGGGSGR